MVPPPCLDDRQEKQGIVLIPREAEDAIQRVLRRSEIVGFERALTAAQELIDLRVAVITVDDAAVRARAAPLESPARYRTSPSIPGRD